MGDKENGNKRSFKAEKLKACNYTCYWCGEPKLASELRLCYKIKLAQGGGRDYDNRIIACEECEQKKTKNL